MRFNIPALPPIQLQSIFQLFLTLAASLLTLRFGAGLVAWKAANNLEKPNYAVVKSLPASSSPTYRGSGNNVEVRKYEPYLIAETTVDESSMREAGGAGFGKCAGYIFGKNRPRTKGGDDDVDGEKMAMTSPVRSSGKMSGRNEKTKVSFVIGSKYDLKSAPEPLDGSVTVKTVKGHYLAATSFAGPPPSDERIREERETIVRTLRREGIRVKDEEETIVYGYHDPVITPNFLRKNEVAVMVDGSSLN
mmetsp:Transcript_29697/g.54523  ORF Transcript_29697/g.54523 Transcript_29697/m.54523 type:complete len:248 (+) Transcript_29697:101-844(+)|eukprot:CAMPEP_0201618502 /NCGR_PEP_ID=MMETSP0492-20130828/39153_1 /ASSEMBLY_ACC=CAM_ASM_000837 /TAXON_ID=420259 /ORGANISM="Thalassiosira gravida, Strain GMp14c1" /LENGTH=247 /DNA_ID=CAMNT_0048087113 /DNA_START=39 /DNA_END=782 /DNA_ORIENTATION=+